MTPHPSSARRPLATRYVPSAYATAPGVHWRRTVAQPPASGVDLDLTQSVSLHDPHGGATRSAARPHLHAAGNGRTAGAVQSGAVLPVAVRPSLRAGAEPAPAAAGAPASAVQAVQAGLAEALARCARTASIGTLIHLRLDALPRWLDLAHAQDSTQAHNTAASYGESRATDGQAPHPAAHDVLQSLRERLLAALPSGSVVDIDASGQAWVVVQPVLSSAAALGWARHLMQLLSPGTHRRTAWQPGATAPVPPPGAASSALPLEISVGVCLFPADADQVDRVMAAACTASAQARARGRGRCQLYNRDITARSRDDLNEGRALAAALGSGGLELSLQGCADLRSGALCSAQVQLSWPRRIGDRPAVATGSTPASDADGQAAGGLAPQGRAAPGQERRVARRDPGGLTGAGLEALARQHGLSEALGREMLGRTCAQLRRWRDEGLAVPQLTLRLPAELLANADFAIELLDLLGRHRLPGQSLALELGQDSLAALSDDTAHLLDSAGITLIADATRIDLLTLTACRHLRVAALVVDLADIGDITVSRSAGRTTLLALAGLARGMEMRLIARSVDHAGELEVLGGTGCNAYQGAVLARPLPARIWTRLLADPDAASGQARPTRRAPPVRAELAEAP